MTTQIQRTGTSAPVAPLQPREWKIASDLMAIGRVVDGVVAVCAAAGFSARHCRFNIPVALTEALSNAIMRGNGNDISRTVTVRTTIQHVRGGATLVMDVTDEGNGFDIGTAGGRPDAPDWLEREDGRGVFLMQSLMDCVECAKAPGVPGNTVRLVLHRT